MTQPSTVLSRNLMSLLQTTAQKATIIFSENPLQLSTDYAADWCHTNYMLLNTKKSMTCTFSLQKTLSTPPPIQINNTTIEEKSSVFPRGFTYNNHLKISQHVDKAIEKTMGSVHGMTRLKRVGVGTKSLTLFYKARILPNLSYAAASTAGIHFSAITTNRDL